MNIDFITVHSREQKKKSDIEHRTRAPLEIIFNVSQSRNEEKKEEKLEMKNVKRETTMIYDLFIHKKKTTRFLRGRQCLSFRRHIQWRQARKISPHSYPCGWWTPAPFCVSSCVAYARTTIITQSTLQPLLPSTNEKWHWRVAGANREPAHCGLLCVMCVFGIICGSLVV